MARFPTSALLLASGILAWACGSGRSVERGAAHPEAAPPLLLITVEGLRWDHSLGAPEAEVSVLAPALVRLASSATVAGSAIATSSARAPALASVLTGVGPWHHGLLRAGDPLGTRAPHLLTLLRDEGYEMSLFRGVTALNPDLGFTPGFDNWPRVRQGEEARNVLRRLTDRQFVWVHLAIPAKGYRRLEPALTRLGKSAAEIARLPESVGRGRWRARHGAGRPIPEEVIGELRLLYRAEVVTLDTMLGGLLDALEESPAAARAGILFTSVVGEALGEVGEVGDGHRLSRHALEVPWVWRAPGEPGSATGSSVLPLGFSTSRTWATLFEAAGGASPPGVAPAWGRPHPEGALAETYQTGGFNQFSWLDREGQQLVWTTPLLAGGRAPGPRAPSGQRRRYLQTFLRTPPMTGLPDLPPSLRVARWSADGTVLDRPFDRQDPGDLRLEQSLRREFLRFVGTEQSVEDWNRPTLRAP